MYNSIYFMHIKPEDCINALNSNDLVYSDFV